MEENWAESIVLGTAQPLFQDQNSLSKDGSAGTPTITSPLASSLPGANPEIATGKQGRCLCRAGCVCYVQFTETHPESHWFLFISPEETRKKETSEVMSCLREFKEWQHFRGNMGLRNSRRRAEE